MPPAVSGREIAELLKPHGTLKSIDVYGDVRPTVYPSFGFVAFVDEGSVSAAATAVHDSQYRGRRLVARALRIADHPGSSSVVLTSRWRPNEIQPEGASETIKPQTENAAPAVEVISRVNARLLSRILKEPEILKSDLVTSRLFEEIVAEIWKGFGYAVELTKRTRDGGRDVVAVRSQYVDERYLIECKRPVSDRKIDVRTIRELYGVTAHERATKGILATTSRFSPDALAFIDDHRWQLDAKDYDGVIRWLRQYFDFSNS